MSLHRRSLGRGPDLVMLHGWGLHGGIFDGIARALACTWRVTLIDLPGHGRSRGVPPVADLSGLAAAVARAAPRRACWLGWSLGGLVALQYALDAPREPVGLILVSASPRFVSDGDWPGVDPETLQGFAAGLDADYLNTLRRFLALQIQGCEHGAGLLRDLRREMMRFPPAPEALRIGLALLRDTDLRPRLGDLAAPTLLLCGDRDRIVPPRAVTAAARLMPASRLHCITGAGHAPFLSHPDEFITAVATLNHEP